MSAPPRVAISCGDPAGIGPEIALRAVADSGVAALLVGPPTVWERAADLLGLDLAQLGDAPVVPSGEGVAPPFGAPTAETGAIALAALTLATDLVVNGDAHALATAPLSKEAIAATGSAHRGHTDWLAARFPDAHAVMGFVGGGLRVALVTVHIPLAEVPRRVTAATVTQTCTVFDAALRTQFGVTAPHIAVCGVNPHAGESGLLGAEDIEAVAPGVAAAVAGGVNATGPLPGDTAFARALDGEFDGVIACYHDQGLAPIKAVARHDAVNVTLGLPIVRTSPAHGTAWDLAGTGRANPASMRAALALAATLARPRA